MEFNGCQENFFLKSQHTRRRSKYLVGFFNYNSFLPLVFLLKRGLKSRALEIQSKVNGASLNEFPIT